MLLRISLILAILAGIATIVVTQLKTREHIQTIITAREANKTEANSQKTRANTAEKNLAAKTTELATTKDALAKSEEELNGSQQRLATAEASLTKTSAELRKSIEDRKNDQAELAKYVQAGLTPEQIKQMQVTVKKDQDSIAALEDEKKILNRRVGSLENDINLLLGKTDYVVKLPDGTKGNVVAVDPKWNFVVLNLGDDKGMLKGGVLLVHRSSQLIGKVRITEVMPDRCIANAMPGWKLGEIEEGDQVLY